MGVDLERFLIAEVHPRHFLDAAHAPKKVFSQGLWF
jgi:hypothetical protein